MAIRGNLVKGGGAVCAVAAVVAVVLANGNVRTNEAGLNLIGNAEGCRADPYKCPADVWTDGIGNTHNVTPGQRKTMDQIAADWERNIGTAEKCVNTYFRGDQLSDDTFSAMTSAAFNLGCNGLKYNASRKATQIWLAAQRRDYAAMCNRLPDFVRSGGKVLPGLVTRRQAEKALCLGGLK